MMRMNTKILIILRATEEVEVVVVAVVAEVAVEVEAASKLALQEVIEDAKMIKTKKRPITAVEMKPRSNISQRQLAPQTRKKT